MVEVAYRQHVLDRLVGALQADERLAGAVLVGSGAVGFQDDESDIDIVAVVGLDHDVAVAYAQRPAMIAGLFPVLHQFESPFSSRNRLHGFLLDGFLELDLSFIALAELRATRDRWRVLFDRTGDVLERMAAPQESVIVDVTGEYRWAFDVACFSIMQCHKALYREQRWEALGLLSEVRGRIFALACLDRFGAPSIHRRIDQLPPDLLAALERTVVPPERRALGDALRQATQVLLEQARALDGRLGLDRAERTAAWLQRYLDRA
jgi:predicted nucleotidyltransferase